ncbi:hypothetical protein ACGH7X_31100 [Streptomyces sp. BBFR51]|uniref:hypothetical protein n=1 Tax=Streptomyces sp. BBFR51 TaxID=3372856 RepID=UPI0037DDA2D9
MLLRTIGTHLREALGYAVAVCLRTVPEMEELVALGPFKGVTVTDGMRCCVVFTIIRTTAYEAFVVWYLIRGRAPAAKGFQEHHLGRVLNG